MYLLNREYGWQLFHSHVCTRNNKTTYHATEVCIGFYVVIRTGGFSSWFGHSCTEVCFGKRYLGLNENNIYTCV